MFKAYFKLPDELGRLSPRLMFSLINGLSGDEVEQGGVSKESVPQQYWSFYGLD